MAVANNHLYQSNCGFCDLEMAEGKSFRISEGVFKRLYNKEMGKEEFDLECYEKTRDILMEAVDKKYRGNYAYNSPDNLMRAKLQENIAVFSGAKTYTQFQEYRALLQNEDETIRTFAEFKEKALERDITYNTNWLKAEYNQAIAQAQNAKNWQRYENDKDLYPNLRYNTVGDDRVRNEHKALDGVIRPVDDRFWNTWAPQNGWGCRCTLEQMDEDAKLTDYDEAVGKGESANVKKMFKDNVGKSQTLFPKGHPYFKFAKDFGTPNKKEWKAQAHYGMKPVREIMLKNSKFPKIDTSIKSIDEYQEWWQKQVDENGTGKPFEFTLKTDLELIVTFDKDFYKKDKTQDKDRYPLIKNVPDTLQNPDEIWIIDNGKSGTVLSTVYIKYYKDQPFMVVTGVDKGKRIRVKSFYIPDDNVNYSSAEGYRRGKLMKRK